MFLDYLAMPKDDPALTRDLVKGISDGCIEADCALVGGETAILPDFYQPGDYDMAGFCVGVVERDHIINGKAIQRRRRGARPGQHRAALQRLQPGAQDRLRHAGLKVERLRAGTGPHRRRGVAGADAHLRPAGARTSCSTTRSSGAWSAAWRTSPASGLVGNVPRVLPPGRRAFSEARQLAGAAGVRLAAAARRHRRRRRWTASSTWASAS